MYIKGAEAHGVIINLLNDWHLLILLGQGVFFLTGQVQLLGKPSHGRVDIFAHLIWAIPFV
jgi:hypothetical protein